MKVNNIAKQVAAHLDVDLHLVYEKVIWPLAKEFGDEFKAYDAFMIASENPDEVFSKLKDPISEEWKTVFVE